MKSLFSRYLQLPRSIYILVFAELLINIISAAHLLIFNLYLRKLGYSDSFIAGATSYRFLGVLLFALPFGIFIKGRQLKRFFMLSMFLIPIFSWVMLRAAESHHLALLDATFLIWGVCLMVPSVAAAPFVMRETTEETRVEAFSLLFSTWPLALMSCGALVPFLTSLESLSFGELIVNFDESGILRVLILIGSGAFPLICFLKESPLVDKFKNNQLNFLKNYDWRIIFRAIFPGIFIAIGAGLTVPFINLFFNFVFDLDFDQFSFLGGCTGILVLMGALLNPYIKRRFGYQIAITLSQTLSVIFLITLAMTEIFKEHPWAFWVAVACYAFRQPLMNMAGPISSELTLSYVGERNRELTSALGASMWSGSWFISAKIFQHLRAYHLEYWKIFLITASLYCVGIYLYWLVIKDHERRNLK